MLIELYFMKENLYKFLNYSNQFKEVSILKFHFAIKIFVEIIRIA